MPDRILRSDFGEDEAELELTLASLGAYTFITRANDNFGCCKDNKKIIRAKAFPGRSRPTLSEIERFFEEFAEADLTDCYEAPDGTKWIFFKRHFRDNRFRSNLKPEASMPPCLKPHMKESQWQEAEVAAFEALSSTALQAAADCGSVPPNIKESNLTKSKSKGKRLPQNFPLDDFKKLFRAGWKRAASDLQINRAKEWYVEHGWKALKKAMETVGGDYGFQLVSKVLAGNWNQGKGDPQVDRHTVDRR